MELCTYSVINIGFSTPRQSQQRVYTADNEDPQNKTTARIQGRPPRPEVSQAGALGNWAGKHRCLCAVVGDAQCEHVNNVSNSDRLCVYVQCSLLVWCTGGVAVAGTSERPSQWVVADPATCRPTCVRLHARVTGVAHGLIDPRPGKTWARLPRHAGRLQTRNVLLPPREKEQKSGFISKKF